MKAEDIIKAIDELAKKFGIAVDWSTENMLPYIQTLVTKYINYCICIDILWIVIGVICLVVAKYFAGIGIKNRVRYRNGYTISKTLEWNEKSDDADYLYYNSNDDGVYVIPFGVAAILFLIATLVTLPNVFHLIRCLTIPEMVIFEYIKSLK